MFVKFLFRMIIAPRIISKQMFLFLVIQFMFLKWVDKYDVSRENAEIWSGTAPYLVKSS